MPQELLYSFATKICSTHGWMFLAFHPPECCRQERTSVVGPSRAERFRPRCEDNIRYQDVAVEYGIPRCPHSKNNLWVQPISACSAVLSSRVPGSWWKTTRQGRKSWHRRSTIGSPTRSVTSQQSTCKFPIWREDLGIESYGNIMLRLWFSNLSISCWDVCLAISSILQLEGVCTLCHYVLCPICSGNQMSFNDFQSCLCEV